MGYEGGLSHFTLCSALFEYFYNKMHLGKIRWQYFHDCWSEWIVRTSEVPAALLAPPLPLPQDSSGRLCASGPDLVSWWQEVSVSSLEAHLPCGVFSLATYHFNYTYVLSPLHCPVSLARPTDALLHAHPWLITHYSTQQVDWLYIHFLKNPKKQAWCS